MRAILLAATFSAGLYAPRIWKRSRFMANSRRAFSTAREIVTGPPTLGDGSFRWTEGAINFASPLTDHLRVGIQLHSYSFGEAGQQKVTLNWAYGDYKMNQFFGIRAGKVTGEDFVPEESRSNCHWNWRFSVIIRRPAKPLAKARKNFWNRPALQVLADQRSKVEIQGMRFSRMAN